MKGRRNGTSRDGIRTGNIFKNKIEELAAVKMIQGSHDKERSDHEELKDKHNKNETGTG